MSQGKIVRREVWERSWVHGRGRWPKFSQILRPK